MISPFFRPNVGGVETHLGDLCRYLQRRRYRVYVLTYQPLNNKVRGLGVEIFENLSVKRISWFGVGLYQQLDKMSVPQFLYVVPMLLLCSVFFMIRHKKEIQMVHAHGLYAAFVAYALKTIFKKKSIVSLHSIYGFGNRPLIARISKHFLCSLDRVLVLSDYAASEVKNLSVSKVSKFAYWIDLNRFKPVGNHSMAKRMLGLEDNLVILFVGRFVEDKGLNLLLEVSSRLKTATFVFAGSGPLVKNLLRKRDEHTNILYLGRVDNEKLPAVYNAADFVWGSADTDYLGRVSMEALACGCPLLLLKSIKLFGVSRRINKGVSDYFLKQGIVHLVENDVDEICVLLKDLSKALENQNKMRLECRTYSLHNFSEENASRITKWYND